MCTSQADALSHWCLTEDLTESIWLENDKAFKLLDKKLEPETNVTLEQILEKSDKFPIEFPTDNVRCKTLQKHVPRESLEKYANSVYPLLHEKVLELCAQYLITKRVYGSKSERELYKNMDIPSFIDRLLTKRAVKFMDKDDYFTLADGTSGDGGWEKIGTDQEKPPLTLKNCLSYGELKISAFLSVSSYTYFINEGELDNEAVVSNNRENTENEGIIIGLVGTRLAKPGVMEYQEIIQDGQNKIIPNPFFNMYNEVYASYECLQQKVIATASRFTEYKPDQFFDNVIYVKRIALSFDTLLQEANARAIERETTAYVHVVGIGLGVWKISDHQNTVFLDCCMERLRQFANRLHGISDVCFANMSIPKDATYKHGDIISAKDHPKGGIKVHIMKRDPSQKLKDGDEGKLLVLSYAWDANAVPGNEFWMGSLNFSGESAAAASSQISELQNPFINPKLQANVLRIVTPNGLITLKDYQEKIRKMRALNVSKS